MCRPPLFHLRLHSSVEMDPQKWKESQYQISTPRWLKLNLRFKQTPAKKWAKGTLKTVWLPLLRVTIPPVEGIVAQPQPNSCGLMRFASPLFLRFVWMASAFRRKRLIPITLSTITLFNNRSPFLWVSTWGRILSIHSRIHIPMAGGSLDSVLPTAIGVNPPMRNQESPLPLRPLQGLTPRSDSPGTSLIGFSWEFSRCLHIPPYLQLQWSKSLLQSTIWVWLKTKELGLRRI